MDFLKLGKEDYEMSGYNKSDQNLMFTVKAEDVETLAEELKKADSIIIDRYAENDGKKGDLYITEQHYGYKPQTILSNYASGEALITMARPTITIKGVANIDRVMAILEDNGYKIEEKETKA